MKDLTIYSLCSFLVFFAGFSGINGGYDTVDDMVRSLQSDDDDDDTISQCSISGVYVKDHKFSSRTDLAAGLSGRRGLASFSQTVLLN